MQEAIVGVIVVCAVWAVARRYAPKAVKRSLRTRMAAAFRQRGWHRAAQRLEQEAKPASGCGDGCSSCGSCESGPGISSQVEFAITPETLRRSARRQ